MKSSTPKTTKQRSIQHKAVEITKPVTDGQRKVQPVMHFYTRATHNLKLSPSQMNLITMRTSGFAGLPGEEAYINFLMGSTRNAKLTIDRELLNRLEVAKTLPSLTVGKAPRPIRTQEQRQIDLEKEREMNRFKRTDPKKYKVHVENERAKEYGNLKWQRLLELRIS